MNESALYVEKYRPRNLAEVRGQARATKFLKNFACHPYPCALLLSGDTGVGKTSAATALAAELGCDSQEGELGGLRVVASGDQNAENVREAIGSMQLMPMFGSGWKVLVVNECDRMTQQAETIWLDALESLPRRSVVVFTTNNPAKLTSRFKDRCISIPFESRASKLREHIAEWLSRVSLAESENTQRTPSLEELEMLTESAIDHDSGTASFRRAVMALQAYSGS